MSVRAFLLIEVKTDPYEVFDVSHDTWLMEQLDTSMLNSDNGGCIMIKREELEDLFTDLRDGNHSLSVEELEHYYEILEKIKEQMGEEDYVEYYCY